MRGNPQPVSPEVLLAQREWVRRVARCLVADRDTAEDLEQDLWVEVLERPPRPRSSLRGWLAVTLRNRLLNLRRSGSRRVRRERSACRREAQPSVEEVVAEADAHRRVVDAVMELAEPYRTALLLRFFEELPPSAAGERLGVPTETVRTRVRRALALLRERLDTRDGGDRGAWALALAPLLRPEFSYSAGSVAGAGTTVGGILVTQKVMAVAAATLLVGGGFTGWAALRGREDPAAGRLAEEAANLRSLAEVQEARLARLERPRNSTAEEDRLRFLLQEQTAKTARMEKAVAAAEGQGATLDRLERSVASLEAWVAAGGSPPAQDPAAERKQALDRLLAITDPRRQIALRDALADLVKIGDPVVPDIVATLDSGFERWYHEPGGGMAMGAGQIRYGSARMTLIDALRQIGSPLAKKGLFAAVGRSKRLTDYRDLLFPYQGTDDPALVEGISALVPDMVRKLAEVGGGKKDYDAQQLARSLVVWIHGHGMAETAGLLEEVVRKARPGPDGWSNTDGWILTLLVEFAPERAAEAILDLQERFGREMPERPPVVALSYAPVFGMDGVVPRAQVARYYEVLFTRGNLDPGIRRSLYSQVPFRPYEGIKDPAKRVEDARVLERFLESRLEAETDGDAKGAIEWQLSQLRQSLAQAGK